MFGSVLSCQGLCIDAVLRTRLLTELSSRCTAAYANYIRARSTLDGVVSEKDVALFEHVSAYDFSLDNIESTLEHGGLILYDVHTCSSTIFTAVAQGGNLRQTFLSVFLPKVERLLKMSSDGTCAGFGK